MGSVGSYSVCVLFQDHKCTIVFSQHEKCKVVSMTLLLMASRETKTL